MASAGFAAVVVGSSAGGLHALQVIFQTLPASYAVPIIVVQHRAKDHKELLEEVLASKLPLEVKQASEKENIRPGRIYFAPPDYHLLIEEDLTFSLTSSEPVVHSRPSIDVLFESAAVVLKEKLVAIILTGASSDGSRGLAFVNECGGFTIAQDPAEAEYTAMPAAAIATGKVAAVKKLSEIGEFLRGLDA